MAAEGQRGCLTSSNKSPGRCQSRGCLFGVASVREVSRRSWILKTEQGSPGVKNGAEHF